MQTASYPIHPPQQKRSRRTLERIMDATEELLETSTFESLSIQRITSRAGLASGSFYTRFPNKNAVLQALFARYLVDTEGLVDRLVASGASQGPLAHRVRTVVTLMVEVFRDRRGVSRAAQLYYLHKPEEATGELRSRLGAMYERLARVVLGDQAGIEHPAPLWASRFAIQLVAASCRAKILFADHPVPDAAPAADRQHADELARAVLGYLTARPPSKLTLGTGGREATS